MKLTAMSTSLAVSMPRPLLSGRLAFVLLVLVLGLVGASGLAATVGGTARNTTTPAYQADHTAAAGTALPPAAAERLGAFSALGAPAGSGAKSAEPAPGRSSADTAAGNTASGNTASGSTPSGITGQSAKIEETGGITLVVPGAQIQPDLSRVAALAVASGGFVASTQTESAAPGTPAQGTITLQVPEPDFNTVLAQVRGLGRVSSLTTSATDVTGQYVDLQARITALQDSRQQYLTIMAKATTIGGILAVQEQLQNLQSQLEQLQGQLQLLNNQTTYATLAVTLSQKAVTPPPPRPESGLLKAWHAAVGGFVAGFEGVVRVAGPLFFALLLLAAVVLVGRWAWKFRPRRSSASVAEPE
jgi:Domain of unknown function (DUF4349)